MHHKSHHFVVVVEVGGSEFDIHVVHYGIYVTIFIQDQVSLEVHVEVLENELDSALAWKDHRVDLLHGIDFPFFDSREIKFNERKVIATGELQLDIFDVKVNIGVFDISPVNLVGE